MRLGARRTSCTLPCAPRCGPLSGKCCTRGCSQRSSRVRRTMSSEPDRARAIERYRVHADSYDASAARTMRLRRRTVAALELAPGEAVLDVACGTGLSFVLLVAAVGREGRVT